MGRKINFKWGIFLCWVALVQGLVLPTAALSAIQILALEGNKEERALELAKHRMAQWLRSHSDLESSIEVIQKPPRGFYGQLKQDEFQAVVDKNFPSKDISPEDQRKLIQGTKFLEVGANGPLFQKVYWILARQALMHQNSDAEIKTFLKSALSLHPRQELGFENELDWSQPENFTLNQKMEELKKNLKPLCQYEIIPAAVFKINGFKVAEDFSLVASSEPYQVSAEEREKKVFCEKQKREKLRVDQSWEKVDKKTFITVEQIKNKIEFSVYTKDIGRDKIPLSRPLLVAEMLANPDTLNLPVSSDAIPLIARHQQAGDFFSAKENPSQTQMEVDSPWYDNWIVWTVIGGIVGTVILTQVLDSSPDTGSQTVGIKVQLD